MLNKRMLQKIATEELIKIYSKTYLQDNFENTLTGYSMLSDGRYMFFAGIKTADDMPDHPADEKGWVVSAQIWLDQETGEVLDIQYTKE